MKNISIFVTGVSGSGKSFVCGELLKLGYRAYDIEEIHGLFTMTNKKTGKIVDDFDNQDIKFMKQHDWVCNKRKLKELMKKVSGETVLDGLVFYCGTASNTDEIFSMFGKVFLLIASEAVTCKRLSTRTSNNFGRKEDMQDWLFTWKKWWEDHLIEKGAIVVDADRDVKEVAKEIINKSL